MTYRDMMKCFTDTIAVTLIGDVMSTSFKDTMKSHTLTDPDVVDTSIT